MKKIFRAAIVMLAMLTSTSAFAQISHGGEPLFNHSNAKSITNIRYLPTIDNDHYLQQDINGVKGAGPMRVSIGQPCNIDVLADAKKTTDANGSHFTLAIQSPNATFVNLHFSKFELADNAELFIYDESGEFILGKFVKEDVMKNGRFFTQAIPGSTAYIEYNVPAGVDPGQITLESVGHGYKDIFQMIDGTYRDAEANMKGPHGDAEGNCHIDVKCPEGDDWKDQIRSVVAIQVDFTAEFTYGGRTQSTTITGMCSGALVNNTRQDRTPYVLSAFHCQDGDGLIDDETRAQFPDIHITNVDFVFYFLYQKYQCNGNNGNGNRSVTGGDIVAKYSYTSGSDMLLIKLRNNIPDTYTPFYAGWDNNTVSSPAPGSCIHHPGGDYKKISIPRNISGNGAFYAVDWYTGSQMKGVTEQGSSGSPLFNADKRIIGQLYAGQSYCNYPQGKDYYGRVSVSWNGGGLRTSRLRDWLDPENTGVTTLDGIDYTDNPTAINPVELQNNTLSVYPNPTSGFVHFDVDYIGKVDYKVFDLAGRCVKEGSTVLTSTVQCVDLSTLPQGTYTLSLRTGSKTYNAQVIKK